RGQGRQVELDQTAGDAVAGIVALTDAQVRGTAVVGCGRGAQQLGVDPVRAIRLQDECVYRPAGRGGRGEGGGGGGRLSRHLSRHLGRRLGRRLCRSRGKRRGFCRCISRRFRKSRRGGRGRRGNR